MFRTVQERIAACVEPAMRNTHSHARSLTSEYDTVRLGELTTMQIVFACFMSVHEHAV